MKRSLDLGNVLEDKDKSTETAVSVPPEDKLHEGLYSKITELIDVNGEIISRIKSRNRFKQLVFKLEFDPIRFECALREMIVEVTATSTVLDKWRVNTNDPRFRFAKNIVTFADKQMNFEPQTFEDVVSLQNSLVDSFQLVYDLIESGKPKFTTDQLKNYTTNFEIMQKMLLIFDKLVSDAQSFEDNVEKQRNILKDSVDIANAQLKKSRDMISAFSEGRFAIQQASRDGLVRPAYNGYGTVANPGYGQPLAAFTVPSASLIKF